MFPAPYRVGHVTGWDLSNPRAPAAQNISLFVSLLKSACRFGFSFGQSKWLVVTHLYSRACWTELPFQGSFPTSAYFCVVGGWYTEEQTTALSQLPYLLEFRVH